MRESDHRILSYIDNSPMAASGGEAPTAEDSKTKLDKIERLMERLGLARYKTKEVIGRGSTVVDRLEFRWGSAAMEFTVTDAKQEKVGAHATRFLNEVARRREWVSPGSPRRGEFLPSCPPTRAIPQSLNPRCSE